MKKVSNVNGDLPIRGVGKTEVMRWNSTDGLPIEGLLIFVPTTTYSTDINHMSSVTI